MLEALFGVIVVPGALLLVLEGGKWIWGVRAVKAPSPVIMTITPSGYSIEEEPIVPWRQVFVRSNDTMKIRGRVQTFSPRDPSVAAFGNSVPDGDVTISIHRGAIGIGDERIPLSEFDELRIATDQWWEPQEALGMGDVKLMAMIGAFLGPGAALFILGIAAAFGTTWGVLMGGLDCMARRQSRRRIPFGSFIAGCTILYVIHNPYLL